MPYNPGIQYRGDQYLYQGISGIGDDIAKVLEERRKNQQAEAASDFLVNHAYNQGQISDDEFNKYQTGNLEQKKGIAFQVVTAIHNDWQQKAAEQAAALHGAQMQQIAQELEATGQPIAVPEDRTSVTAGTSPSLTDELAGDLGTPPTATVIQGQRTIGVWGPRGQAVLDPYAKQAQTIDEPIQVDAFIDPVTGKPVPGMGIVRKTGQIGYFNTSGLVKDKETGALGTRDTRGNFKPLTAQQVTAMQMSTPTPTPTPKPSPGILSRLFGGGGSSVPAATPAPVLTGAAVPAVGEVRRGYRFKGGDPSDPNCWDRLEQGWPTPAPASGGKVRVISPQGMPGYIPAERLQDYLSAGYTAGPALSAQDQQALAWARANPSDPRAAAILKKLGLAQ